MPAPLKGEREGTARSTSVTALVEEGGMKAEGEGLRWIAASGRGGGGECG